MSISDMSISELLSQIRDEEKSPIVLLLIAIIQAQAETIRLQAEEIQKLRDEIARLKGLKPKPQIKPSTLEKKVESSSEENSEDKRRPGSDKRNKTKELVIHKEKIIKPDIVPEGSTFKGYQDYVVQDIIFEPFNTLFRLERWEGPNGEYIIGKLPKEIKGHFGIPLKTFILYQHYQAHVTQPLIYEQLQEIGIDISKGKINDIITEDKEEILEAGL